MTPLEHRVAKLEQQVRDLVRFHEAKAMNNHKDSGMEELATVSRALAKVRMAETANTEPPKVVGG